MSDNSKRTGPAVETHYQFLTWLMPTVEKFPRSHKFTIADRIEIAALDVLDPSQFLGFELYAGGRRFLPEDNVRRFRNRLRGLRDQWRVGTIWFGDVNARVGAWIAHAGHADTWRLRHAIFRGCRFDPASTPEAWTAPCRRVVRGGSWNNNPQNLRSANRNRNTTDNRNNNIGFRVGSTLSARADAIMVASGAH